MTKAMPRPCQAPGCPNLKVPGRGSKLCQEHRDTAYQRKLEGLRSKGCRAHGCDEPKLFGRGYKYCAQHSSEAVKGSPAYNQRASVMQVRRMRERRLGVTHDEFMALLSAQGGVCAICGNGNDGERQLSIDHDHATGQVRALLCDRCNPMLGHARDSIAVLEAAIEYLKRYQVFNPVIGLYLWTLLAAFQLLLKLTGPPMAPSALKSGRIVPNQ